AARFGHTIVEPRPELVPLLTDAVWVTALRGLTIGDVQLAVVEEQPTDQGAASGKASKRVLTRRRGSFLFTHFGLSGPVALDVSREVSGHSHPEQLVLE